MRLRHLACAAALAVALPACAVAAGEHTSILDAETLRIGVKGDQPGLGLRTGVDTYSGFDVDVAYYIADYLGVDRADVEFVQVTSEEREDVLVDDDVDLVLATYSITQLRKTVVNFAGPYYVARQDILVRADNTDVQGPEDLAGERLCQGAGSNSANRIIEERGIPAQRVERPTYSECVDLLAVGVVDAVSTDDLILAGYLAEKPSAFRLVGEPFTSEKYGIGIAKEDIAGCEAVNRAVTLMYQDGTAERLLDKWFGQTGLDLVTTVPQFEGCG
ncbi:glutamate transport system substrate-binding protein [Streptomonospora nanhaiensis]|uniref:Glutamate transport system substrate-binding protein n=1 Tax=Streptomonospora nanhaiensis TaxID=1323731 RepID=A0A853BRU8_9ACTN|nr:glutamate ABC transporter substrate-binding protein [Streptomonospora nanhaiensis]NYI97436.1 glutamate transport system substrate-binding protein [Streptomonospora nanhaiensis]